MPVTIDIPKAVFDFVNTAVAADTGSGGLKETGGVAFIRHVIREGDPIENDNIDWPQLRVAVLAGANQSGFEFQNRPEVVVRFTVVTKRERGFGSSGSGESGLDNILIRIRNLFNGMTVAGSISGGWDSTILHLIRGPVQAPGTTNEMRHLYEFDLIPKST